MTKIDTSCRILLTNHCRERAATFGLTFEKAMWMILNSHQDELPRDLRLAAHKRYGEEQKDIEYYRWGSFVFVVKNTVGRDGVEPIKLVLTVYDQAMDAGMISWQMESRSDASYRGKRRRKRKPRYQPEY